MTLNGAVKSRQRAQVGISKRTYSQNQNTVPQDLHSLQVLQDYESHAENAQWALVCCFSSLNPQCFIPLCYVYQRWPHSTRILQPPGRRHVVLRNPDQHQPHPQSPAAQTPGITFHIAYRGPGSKACYRQNSENKSQKHISDLGIYTGAAPQCLILFNRGSKKFISNGNGFFIFSAIWFQHPNAQNCEMTSPAGMVRGLLNLRSFIINLTVCVGAFAKSEASFMCWLWRSNW